MNCLLYRMSTPAPVDVYGPIRPFPGHLVQDEAQLSLKDLQVDDCCPLRSESSDEAAQIIAHSVKWGELDVEPEDMAKKLLLELLSSKSDAGKDFAKARTEYMRKYEPRDLRQLKSSIAHGQPIQDPCSLTVLARACNLHVGIFFKSDVWCTKKDSNVWLCDVIMAACNDPSGGGLIRFMHVRQTQGFEGGNEFVCVVPADQLVPYKDEESCTFSAMCPNGKEYQVPVNKHVLQNMPGPARVRHVAPDGARITLHIKAEFPDEPTSTGPDPEVLRVARDLAKRLLCKYDLTHPSKAHVARGGSADLRHSWPSSSARPGSAPSQF